MTMDIYNIYASSLGKQNFQPGEDKTLTITSAQMIQLEEGNKVRLAFAEIPMHWILNKINAQTIAQVMGTGDASLWIGKQITVYVDQTVSYRGAVTGGVRVRPAAQPPQQPQPATNLPQPVDIAQQTPQQPPRQPDGGLRF